MQPRQTSVWSLVACAVVACSIAGPLPARAATPQRFRGLAVGINRYRDPSLRPLRGAVNDARRVAALLERQAPGSRMVTLTDEDASCDRVLAALKDLETDAEPGDFLVVFLSGHGGASGGTWQFACHDFPLSDVLLANEVEFLVRGGHHVLVAIDACQAGQIGRQPAFLTKEVLYHLGPDGRPAPGGLILLTGCYPAEFSRDGKENGLFTTALLDALRGRADADDDGLVNLKELRTFLTWRMDELTWQLDKLPGLPWPEQNVLCRVSASIPETLELARSDRGGPLMPGDQWNPGKEAHVLHPRINCHAESLDGVWRAELPILDDDGAPVRGNDGKPLVRTFLLSLEKDGQYEAVVAFGDTLLSRAVGSYAYQPPRARSFLDLANNVPPNPAAEAGVFRLDYSNGSDAIDIESATDDRLEIVVHLSGGYQRKAAYELRRVVLPRPSR